MRETFPERKVEELKEKARQIRVLALKMIGNAKSGHPGGALSAADIIAVLYFHKMRYDPNNPYWEDRDRFVLSKGHASAALYAALALAGVIPMEEIYTFRKLNSRLQGHPARHELPGVEASTGSLGQGLSIANGMALAGKLDGKNYRVYVLLGDGEIQEGQVWEAAMSAVHYKLDNLTAILDRNMIQLDGFTEDIMRLDPVAEKWKGFGWNTIEIDGHNIRQIMDALDEAEKVKGRPTIIIARTIKGKGVSFMENTAEFHGKPPTPEQLKQALMELGEPSG